MSKNRYAINSVLRAVRILECFSFEKPTLRNSEISKMLGLNKSAVTRILSSLKEAGFLKKEDKTGEFRLTHKLYRIGSIYIQQVDLRKEAIPILTRLSELSGETVHLAVLRDFEVFYIDKIECSQSIGMRSRIGNKSPAYCTGVGKVMLAYLKEAELETFFRTVDLKRYTPNTICDENESRQHLARIKAQGYAIDDVEHESEVRCVAAPVLDEQGEVHAAISVAGPVFRMNREKIETLLISAVRNAAAEISQRMGYTG